MATTRKQGATDQTQDAPDNQQNNHAQTPDQSAANHGAFAQSSYQNTQQGATTDSSQRESSDEAGKDDAGNLLDTAVQASKKWLDESGVLKNANQLPQTAKEWGTKALSSVNALSTTQKVVGGALLLAGAAYLSTRGKSKKNKDADYRAGGKSSGYRQGSWAGYAGGKSASSRNAQSGSRSDVSSYGTERRATGSSANASYGRGASSSSDNDFGGGQGSSQPQGSYRSGSTYGATGSYGSGRNSGSAGSPASSSMGGGRSSVGSSPNSNEQDYDVSL